MAYEYTQNPPVGEPGVGEQNWGDILNNILDELKSAANNNFNLIGNHNHPEYASTQVVDTLLAWYNTLNPDTSGVDISTTMHNTYWGLTIFCSTNPNIYVRTWQVTIRKAGNIIYQASQAGSLFYVPEGVGFSANDTLGIEIKLYTGITSTITSDPYTHIYDPPTVPAIGELQSQLSQLTMGNIIDSFIQSEPALTALANTLQGSNLLATKVANLIKDMA
jgi:hypothetical protein